MTTAATKPRRNRPKPTEPLAHRLADLPRISGLSGSGWRNAIASGEVRAVRRGRVVLISHAEVLRYLGVTG